MVGGTARLGLLGGTFDPPHIGHVRMAQQVRTALGLDEVLMVVANQPWQKVGSRSITSAEHRLAMVAAAVKGIDGVEASSIEMERGGDSFTIDTIEALATQFADSKFYLIVGADAAEGLHTWHRFEELADLADLVIVNRPGWAREIDTHSWPTRWRDGSGVYRLDVEPVDTSSTDLRERLSTGSIPPGSISESVLRYIHEHRLYSGLSS
jgi:nicotinate-nucleotide adenylyltransferase